MQAERDRRRRSVFPVERSQFLAEIQCSICAVLIHPSVMKSCPNGHLFCEPCITTQLALDPHCPVDQVPLRVDQLSDCPIACRIVGRMIVYCPLSDHGRLCPWQGPVSDVDGHLAGVAREDLDSHIEPCALEIIDCPNECSVRCQRSTIGEHLRTCPKQIIDCPNKCTVAGQQIRQVVRGDVGSHRDVCDMQDVQCKFWAVGCTTPLRRKDITSHEETSVEHHRRLLEAHNAGFVAALQRLAQLEANEQTLKRELTRLEARMVDQESRLATRLDDVSASVWRVANDNTNGRSSRWRTSTKTVRDATLDIQVDRSWERVERLCLELKTRDHEHRAELDRLRDHIGNVIVSGRSEQVQMTWWLTCEHLVAATPLFSSDFVAFGLSFELGVTAPSSTDGWRGFCVRVVNRKGSGAFRVVMSYEVSIMLPDGRSLVDGLRCAKQVYQKSPGQDNWGFRRFLKSDSDQWQAIMGAGGMQVNVVLTRSYPSGAPVTPRADSASAAARYPRLDGAGQGP
ncbi:unnamed protein product (mitochondrion) [Plasmodiophora brassicae]|uniref:TRAF-type domain-containing protein n=1 Tax=Plasmodiophora brassicae TaxID=37360 RepID=A0A3P3Y0N5_PLABS|nr:unnamed protein product [Plasmodiophora brassicae]